MSSSLSLSSFAKLVEALPIGVLIEGVNDHILYANACVQDWLGFETLVGLQSSTLYKDTALHAQIVQELTQESSAVSQEMDMLTRKGDVRLMRAVFALESSLLITLLFDITSTPQPEQRTIPMLKLAKVVHELRTPLNTILAQSESLLEMLYGTLTKKQVESVRLIEMSGNYMLGLINDLMDQSQILAGSFKLEMGDVDISRLCESSISMVAGLATQKQVRVQYTLDQSVENIRGDERRLQQILVNLLSNAIKFTPQQGVVRLEILGDSDQQTVTFAVNDNGPGINGNDLARLFKPFVQLDNAKDHQASGGWFVNE